ncbi:pantoate--beta-alanine ligase [Fibrella forsythiae]|uniref:Pantothenate synthetase n=1 Tax=Fibrella forsythiae TaxID=2817061 RepID=A0ABS3JJC5_9BACT|nr:pantoate--beta-alanine ligase [Fibrella forsythiae]MBO0950104.1 pantoate--beta-alanine ligase [Fibrella forsythiae]
MHHFSTVQALQHHLNSVRRQGESIGFVPTMGALHTGHLNLVERAKSECDVVVCSIFVNPTQFNNPDDLARYPRTLDEDSALLERVGTDVIFSPSVAEMYPEPATIRINFGALETVMEGASRPGHFNGVGLVVSKLFHMVGPDKAYFGQKDLQQVAVIRQLVRDLNFPLELVRCDTVRDEDGLAMSSRNRLLSPKERTQAPTLFEALTLARNLLLDGYTPEQAKASVRDYMAHRPAFTLDYIEVVNTDTLQPAAELQPPGQTALCIAAQLGKVRLIDNVVF